MAEKKEAVTKARKESRESVGPMDAFNSWLAYIKRNAVRYYTGLLKIGLATLLASWILLIVMLLIGFALLFSVGAALGVGGMLENASTNVTALAMIIIGGLIGFVILKWVERTIQMTALIYTDAEFSGRKFDLIKSALRIYWPVFRLTLADMGLFILFLVPAVLLAAFGMANASDVSGGIAILLIFLYVIVMAIAYTFLTQFWSYGVVLEGRGVRDSLKQSLRIVKRSIMDVLVFDAIWVVGILVFAIPVIIYSFISGLVDGMLQVMMENGDLAIIGVYLLFAIVNAIISVVLTTIMEAFATPTHYLFWKSVKGP
ncbi:MAG: hypothetical protein PHF60_03355 [Candidatus ainarchaeum sp.]|nr:hypothetical protein [Candidatus ainarchaeum sp.]